MRHAARAAGQHSSAFSFSRGGSKKRIKVFASVCTGSCRPPAWPADMIRNRLADARRFRTATAHSAYALYVVMPIPLAALAQKGRQFEYRQHEKNTAGHTGLRCFSGAAGQIRTATAHIAYAMCTVMPFPLAALAQKGRQFKCQTTIKKNGEEKSSPLFFGAAGQIRTATAHSAYALYVVMPIPLAALAQKVGSSNTYRHEESSRPSGATAFLELLGRFELPTSSLPRMRSTY